jgi:phosphoserine phosphatase
MDSVIVLIAAPKSGAIDRKVLRTAQAATDSDPIWLAEQEALELYMPAFAGMPELMEEISTKPIDIAVLPASNRRKRLLLADMDSTIIGQECVDELGALAGVGGRISAITARAMAGDLDFEAALRERVALLAGLQETAIAEVLTSRITYKSGGSTLIATMKAHGAYTALVSGGFVQFTGHVARSLGFDEHRANELVIEEGALSGTVREPILGRDAKLEALQAITAELGISPADALAVGDGANDIPMLKAAGLGVALHAKPQVQAEAPIRINHGDLTALLYLQGFRRDEFVAPT